MGPAKTLDPPIRWMSTKESTVRSHGVTKIYSDKKHLLNKRVFPVLGLGDREAAPEDFPVGGTSSLEHEVIHQVLEEGGEIPVHGMLEVRDEGLVVEALLSGEQFQDPGVDVRVGD